MFNELIEANLDNDIERVLAVVRLLKELRAGWHGMQDANAPQQPAAQAQAQTPAQGQAQAQAQAQGNKPAPTIRRQKSINMRY